MDKKKVKKDPPVVEELEVEEVFEEEVKNEKRKLKKYLIPGVSILVIGTALAISLPLALAPKNPNESTVTDPSLIGKFLTQEKMNKLAFEATTATETPANLTAVKVSDNSVELSWTAVDKCQGYQVYRYDILNGKYVSVAKTTEPKFTDTTVLSGSDYKYKVRAYIQYSQYFYSGYSNEVSVKTTGEPITKIGTVNVSDVLNIRAEASTSATIIIQLKANTKVYITGESGDWYKITASVNGVTYTGFAHKDYIIAENISSGSTSTNKETCPYAEPTATLRQGSTGESVKWLQWHLYKLGYLKSTDVDGDFGPTTLSAVKKYQTDKGLDVDGVVGSGTRGQLIKDFNAL